LSNNHCALHVVGHVILLAKNVALFTSTLTAQLWDGPMKSRVVCGALTAMSGPFFLRLRELNGQK